MRKDRLFWNLRGKRAKDTEEDLTLTHVDSRHRGDDRELVHEDCGMPFGRGTQFPPHVNAGNIREMEKTVEGEWRNYTKGHPSNIKEAKPAGDAMYVEVRMDKYGVRLVGGFLRQGQVATIFPEEACGGNLLNYKGRKIKKYKDRNND
ncbi:hypothetical protein JXA63_03920 [Candidatus Woesebacteria bacterium]|nr:hypothetical protein [Candidatus Woesebacteria bacterium]